MFAVNNGKHERKYIVIDGERCMGIPRQFLRAIEKES